MLQLLSVRKYHLADPWRTYFSVVVPALWSIFLQDIRFACTLLAFYKTLKTWLCCWAWGQACVVKLSWWCWWSGWFYFGSHIFNFFMMVLSCCLFFMTIFYTSILLLVTQLAFNLFFYEATITFRENEYILDICNAKFSFPILNKCLH